MPTSTPRTTMRPGDGPANLDEMTPFLRAMLKSFSQKEVQLPLETYTANELLWLNAYCITMVPAPQATKPSISEEILQKLDGNIYMGKVIASHAQERSMAETARINPFTWDQEKLRLQVPVTETKEVVKGSSTSTPTKVEKVTVDDVVYTVPNIFGIPVLVNLKGKTEKVPVAEGDLAVSNATVLVGSLTEWLSSGAISPAVGLEHIQKMKIPYISKHTVLLLCKVVQGLVATEPTPKSSVSGLEWMRYFYSFLMTKSKRERMLACGMLQSTAYSANAPFLRPYSKDDVEKWQLNIDGSRLRHQVGVLGVSRLEIPTTLNYEVIYSGMVGSRDFRKSDGQGMSAANQGCYTNEFVSKATRSMHNKLAVLQSMTCDIHLYIITNDCELIRHFPQVIHKTRVPRWSVVSEISTKIPGVTIVARVPTMQNCAVIFYPDVSFPTFEPDKGFPAFVDTHKVSYLNVLDHWANLHAAVIVFPCKIQDLKWNLQRKGEDWHYQNCMGPAPHNLEYYKVFKRVCVVPKLPDKDDVDFADVSVEASSESDTEILIENGPPKVGMSQKRKTNQKTRARRVDADQVQLKMPNVVVTTAVSLSQYLISCNISNAYRNSWFLHRQAINDVLETYQINVVPSAKLCAPPKLKYSTKSEIDMAYQNGSNPDSVALFEFYEKYSEDEMTSRTNSAESTSNTTTTTASTFAAPRQGGQVQFKIDEEDTDEVPSEPIEDGANDDQAELDG